MDDTNGQSVLTPESKTEKLDKTKSAETNVVVRELAKINGEESVIAIGNEGTMVRCEPMKMNDEESMIVTRHGDEDKEEHIVEKTNDDENTREKVRNKEEMNKEVRNEEVTLNDKELTKAKGEKKEEHMVTKENNEEKVRNEEEMDKEVKNEDDIERDSKEKIKKPKKRNRRKKMASRNINAMMAKDDKKLEDSLDKISERKNMVPSGSNKVAVGDSKQPKSLNTNRKRKRMARVTNALTTKGANELESSDKKTKKGKMALNGSNEEVTKDIGKQKSSKKTTTEKVKSMGMIFMCSSKTKKDCYRYKVLGLPENKKDIVLKIYEGMRLFLYDFDLRLMYGVYKAAGPGGYNIEPRAFKSAFPAQVRFTVLEDCLPLAEEKFKKVIKDNYYTKNKFDGQLTSEQVKNLCNLFRSAHKVTESKGIGRSPRAETRTYGNRKRARRHKAETHTSGDRKRTRQHSRERERGHNREQERHYAYGRGRLYGERPVYEREAFASSLVHATLPPPLPQPLGPAHPLPSYVYERASELGTYRQEPLSEHHDRRLSDLELRHRDGIEYRDPYVLNRDPFLLYRERPLYRDPLYSTGALPEYRFAEPHIEYRPLTGPQPLHEFRTPTDPLREYHPHPPPGLLPEYHPLPPLHRY